MQLSTAQEKFEQQINTFYEKNHHYDLRMKDNFIEVHTPYTDECNDKIILYIEISEDGRFELNDGYYVVREMEMLNNFLFSKQERTDWFYKTVRDFDLKFDEEREVLFTLIHQLEEFPTKMEDFVSFYRVLWRFVNREKSKWD